MCWWAGPCFAGRPFTQRIVRHTPLRHTVASLALSLLDLKNLMEDEWATELGPFGLSADQAKGLLAACASKVQVAEEGAGDLSPRAARRIYNEVTWCLEQCQHILSSDTSEDECSNYGGRGMHEASRSHFPVST